MRILSLLAVLVLLSSTAIAHDLYLVADRAKNQVCARVGEQFPETMNAVTPQRVGSFRVRDAAGKAADLKGTVANNEYCAPVSLAGPAIAEMTIFPQFIRIEAKGFNEYIHGEGFKAVEKSREQNKKTQTEGRELYSRSAKALIGSGHPQATKPLGHILEIVPEKDPATLKAGEPLRVTVYFQGKPLADAQVAAVYSGFKAKGHEFPFVTRTDTNGKAELKLDRPGLWYARMIYMVPAVNDPEIEWRSYFSTMVFEVGGK